MLPDWRCRISADIVTESRAGQRQPLKAVWRQLRRSLTIRALLHQTTEVCAGLKDSYTICMDLFGKNYMEFSEDQKKSLGALVNQTKALAALFEKTVS